MQPAPAPLPPPTDPDDLEQLGEQIAELAAQITAATYQLLTMLREFDEREGWNCGFRTCAHWLSWRTGLALGPAREKVRVARALGELPGLSEAMRRGRISYSKVRALTRVATPENEQELLEFAMAGTASHVERLVRAWRRVDRIEEREREELRHASRYLSLWTDEDGMVVVRGRLDPEAGAALIRAVEAGCDVLYDEEKEREAAGRDGVPAGQRRADAIGRVAEAALAGGLDRGTRGDRYQVVVHVDAAVLEEAEDVPAGTPGEKGDRYRFRGSRGAAVGPSERNRYLSPFSLFEIGVHVPAETSRRIACDASKVVMTHDAEGNLLDLGRRTRVISPALRRALDHRDGGCRFPGCGVPPDWAVSPARPGTDGSGMGLIGQEELVAESAEPKKPVLFVVRQVRFKPPPPRQQQEVPQLPTKRVPIPDPTPDEPEPIRLAEEIEPEIDLSDSDPLLGLPDAPPRPEPSGPIPVGGDVKPPKKIHAPNPQFTEIARKARIQGVVIVEAIIDQSGNVTDVEVLKGLPLGLDQAVVDAVRRWKFEPATLDGKPVAVIYHLTVNFCPR